MAKEVSKVLKTITTKGLKALMDKDEKLAIVNVLDRELYAKEHICGSISIPLGEIKARAPGLLQGVASVVVYCSGPACMTSEPAGWKFEELGFVGVMRYEGGTEEWKEAGYCVEGKRQGVHA
jgi:rhodanese-related sulfurtransferase